MSERVGGMRKSLHEIMQGACGQGTTQIIRSFIAAFFFVPFLFACGGGGDSGSGTTTSKVLASISITPATASIAKGLTTSFTATGRYSDNTTADITSQVIWTSSNNAVATINTTGVATGVSFGGVAVIATLNDVSSPAAMLTVTSAVVTGIAIGPPSASSPKSTPVTYTATGTFSDGTTGNISGSVTWASSNTAVATLNGSGIASTLAKGSTTITASTNNITSNSATLTVTAPQLASLSITPSSASITAGNTQQFSATGTLSDGTAATLGPLTWTSSDTSVATIDSTGLVTTLAVGSTNISADSAGIISNTAVVTVVQQPPTPATVGPFTASYYNGTTFVASESVARPSIRYAWADFNGIDSPNFHAIWTGNIEVFDTPKLIDMNFEVSWSDVSLFVDGVAIASWSNSNTTIQHEFSPGIHEVKIEYFNHWHTTGFDVSFTTNTMYTKADAISLIAPQIDANTKIIYVGAYESADLYNNSKVTLSSATGKVFLFLTSYSSINWIIQNPANVTITGIAYSSYSTGATVTADTAIPQFEIAWLAYGYTDFSAPSADITSLIGRAPDYLSGAYGLTEAVISIP